MQTIELNYPVSSSLDDASWRPLIGLNAVYTYQATYAEMLKAYNQQGLQADLLVEAGYEFEQNNSSYLARHSGDAAASGVLEPSQRCVRTVLREQVHVAVPPGLEEQPRHARQHSR